MLLPRQSVPKTADNINGLSGVKQKNKRKT